MAQIKISIGYLIVLSQLYLAVGHFFPISMLLVSSPLPDDSASLAEYKKAKNLRVKEGHSEVSTAVYRELLIKYQDVTAATRIAAASSSPFRHDKACPLPENLQDNEVMNAITKLRSIFIQIGYTNQRIQDMFGLKSFDLPIDPSETFLTKTQSLGFATGPIYVKPISARAQSQLPFFLQDLVDENDKTDSSLKCLVALFLLGFAVPKDILSQQLKGELETIHLLERLGLAFPCEIDPSMIVPYVHIFPLQIQILDEGELISKTSKPLFLVTDCHPTILSRTTVGTKEDGAVMYIGPDSLALVQHTPIRFHLSQALKERRLSSSKQVTTDEHFQVLDFCTGSGVQALATLTLLERVDPAAKAVCIDINERALRFTKFNSFLNGFDETRIEVIKADLTSGIFLNAGSSTIRDVKEGQQIKTSNTLDSLSKTNKQFDVILGNPPFIPIPKVRDNHSEMISKRYGLFSSGGSSGEEVLKAIIAMSSRLLRRDGGILAIVSEFMNPPTTSNPTDLEKDNELQLLNKIRDWWECPIIGGGGHLTVNTGKGLLFTNQLPLSTPTYASRRANDAEEYTNWIYNLESQNIRNVSPGLLYIKTESSANAVLKSNNEENRRLDLGFKLVPKDNELGSIWTPYNYKAVLYTAKQWEYTANS